MIDPISANHKMHRVGHETAQRQRTANGRDLVFAELDTLIATGRGNTPRLVIPKDRERLKALLESNKGERT